MRVGVIAIQYEANSFLQGTAGIDAFQDTWLYRGEAARSAVRDSFHEVGGFYRGLDAERIEAVPLLVANAVPGPVIAASARAQLLEMMQHELRRALPLDGILAAPHGAAVAEDEPDMDGQWLSMLREIVGPEVPLVCTLDLHANLSQRMVDACDAMISYRTNPHLDQRDRGIEAATLIARILRGEVRATQAAAMPPIAINIERQLTRDEPCRSWYALIDDIRRRSYVLSASVNLGFPYCDVSKMGASSIVVTDYRPKLARKYADEIASYLLTHRQQFVGELISIDEALDRSVGAPKPVGLLDMGDNVGGGSAADGTFIAHALESRGDLKGFVALCDPESSAKAQAAGQGARISMGMGGKTDDQHGSPLVAEVTVLSVNPTGEFVEPQARHGGRTSFAMGLTAVVRTDRGLTIQLTSRRQVPWSLGQLTCCGIDPASFDVIVIKGVHAPVAAYEEVCRTLIRVNTPGSTTADMSRLTYHRRRRPLFPFEDLLEGS
jgi:microcystin degradation protein MlrC